MTLRKRILTAAMIGMMLFSTTLVHAATVNTFASGDSDVTVELRNQGVWADDLSAGIALPAGETVNSAGLIVGTDYAEHDSFDRVDSSLMDYIWDPTYNTGLTQYSTQNDFTYGEDYIKLTSLGYNADFEGFENTRSWTVGTDNGFMTNWEHGIETDAPALSQGCATGNWCWGTDFMGADYTMWIPDTTHHEYVLTSESFYVTPGKSELSFGSFHSMFYRGSGTSYYYDDCAYVAVRNSSNNQDWNTLVYAPFDLSGTSGISAQQGGLYQLGTTVNQVPTSQCNYLGANGPSTGDYVLAGNGSTVANAATGGWSHIEVSLNRHAGQYVQVMFILEVNSRNGNPPADMMNAGWYVDSVRVGDPLPAQGEVLLSSFAPQSSGQPGFPDGYGLLQMDLEKPQSTSFGVDVLDAGDGSVVIDRNGNPMSNLQGSLIELWDINADTYPLIDLRLNFGSGSARLASPTMHGFTLGSRIGTTFNNTDSAAVYGGSMGNGKWISSMSEESNVMVASMIQDESFAPGFIRNTFSMPIVAIKPVVEDSCGGPSEITILSLNNAQIPISATNHLWSDFSVPTFGFALMANYTTMCDVFSVHADVRFAHHAEGITLDVAGDGDIEWAMNDPAFGHFGRQDMFRSGLLDGVNLGSDEREITLNILLEGEGAPFLLPKGATVNYAEMSFDQNTVGAFDLTLISGSEEVPLGEMPDTTILAPSPGSPLISIQNSLQSLLDNPSVPTAAIDNYGNEWYLFRLKIEADSGTAISGDSVNFRNLEILYDWSRAINDDNNVARELNQGVALASEGGAAPGSNVIVPMLVSGNSGGAISLSSLSISTTSGYSSTLDSLGLEGLYPNGSIVEMVSTHDVSASTGQTLGGASLLFETPTGNLELRWAESNDTFWEESDPDDRLEFRAAQSLSLDMSSGKELKWRFRVNPEWDDTRSVRVYASALSNTGVNGLPAGALLEPLVGNAVENDISITDFHLFNEGGIEQVNLTEAYSSNAFTLEFDVKYEDLEFAPNPDSYEILLEKENQSNPAEEWLFVDSIPGNPTGTFSWTPSLPFSETGTEFYRMMIFNYTDGDHNCPPAIYSPDANCAIRFTINLDPFSPYLNNISVQEGLDWRVLGDTTWIPSREHQKFRVIAQDIPLAPETLTFNYWIEASHDDNDDREAQLSEYQQKIMNRIEFDSTASYEVEINDLANAGVVPPQMVSIFISGGDIGGNAINGGSVGLNQDLVTYIGMGQETPYPERLRISDSNGVTLTDLNNSMHPGNVYHLQFDGNEPNGWRDVELIRISLNPDICNSYNTETYDPAGTMDIYYSPQNDTAWEVNGNTWVEIIDDYESTGLKPMFTRRDGGTLVSSFEQDFTLDIPIRLDWAMLPAYVEGTMYPVVTIQDFNRDLSGWSPPAIQQQFTRSWKYSSGLMLDTSSFLIDDTSGFKSSNVGDSEGGYVTPGDALHFDGRYVFRDGYQSGTSYVTPEMSLSLEITTTPLYPNGEVDLPGSGYQSAQESVMTYVIQNGTVDELISAPAYTNEYKISLKLLDCSPTLTSDCLPTGAFDFTEESARTFIVKVDGDDPAVVGATWELSNSNSGIEIVDSISSAEMHCLDVELFIEEKQQMDSESVKINWMFFQTFPPSQVEYNWSAVKTTFNADHPTPIVDWFTANLSVESQAGGLNRVTSKCLDIWPDDQIPEDMEDITVKFWISGYDTAGTGIGSGGAFGSSVIGGTYNVEYESAKFILTRVSLSTEKPMAQKDFDLIMDVENQGNKQGVFTIQLLYNVSGEYPLDSVVAVCPESILPMQPGVDNSYTWRLSMDQFPQAATNVRIEILDEDGESLYTTPSFNVAKYSAEEDDAGGMMIWIAIAGVICVLIAAIVVIMVVLGRGSSDEEDEYIDDEDFLPPGQAVEPIRSRGPPATRPGERRGPPGASREPPVAASPVRTQMDIAREKFPFWDEATIQGYFDQGWNVEQLEEWLASQ